MAKRSSVVVISLLALVTSVAGTAHAATPTGTSGELCEVVSPAGTAGAGNVPVDEGAVVQMHSALQQASSLSLPKRVKKAVKTLLPLYEKLATGTGDKALATLAAFVEEECGAAAAAKGGKNAGDLDPCELLTLEDAQALAGTPLDPGVPSPPEHDTRSCTYTGPVTGPTAQVEFHIGPGAKKALDIDRDLGHTFTTVLNLGDEAYREDFNIFWRQGGRWFWIRLVLLRETAETTAPRLENLARQISDRL